EERIFGPLGMDRTHFRDDHERVVPDRAYAYAPDPDEGWKISIPDFAIVGASSLFTTVEDLAKWERNFRTAEVGGRDAVDGMLHRVAVGDDRHAYSHGLFGGEHRGLRTVSHGGADAGYRSHFRRYPEQGLAVAVLCNAPGARPGERAREVAGLYLADAFTEPADEEEAGEAELPAGAPVEKLAGWYANRVNDLPLRISQSEEDGLSLATGNRPSRPLVPAPDTAFRVGSTGNRIVVPADRSQWGRTIVVDDGAGAPIRYRRAQPADTGAGTMAAFEGWYWSDELGTFYRVRRTDEGGLELWQRRLGALAANPMQRDAFSVYFDFLALTFTRGEDGRVDGFTLSGPRTWKLRFRRVEKPAP
ncbi:MAG: serine hydrolase, partial [Gemmatimonadetes bacterium]|nr:serine hydrolase [Gemmatimonadota bacterium]NIR79040.1 serine hydrolase [Gemmatimonadota bacterium]NIT86057.1 serine hydrolase [Gemmatimonadota bacterium]NIU31558.1 serine hydrolase [Gemmatimonadota bacterium]NIU36214.1 serine hydrolase [Gemmatimonadota bacterium]